MKLSSIPPVAYAVIAILMLIPAFVGNDDGLGAGWFVLWTMPTSLVFLALGPVGAPEPLHMLWFVTPAIVNTAAIWLLVRYLRH